MVTDFRLRTRLTTVLGASALLLGVSAAPAVAAGAPASLSLQAIPAARVAHVGSGAAHRGRGIVAYADAQSRDQGPIAYADGMPIAHADGTLQVEHATRRHDGHRHHGAHRRRRHHRHHRHHRG